MELIKRNEVMQFQFYSVPKIFFVEKKYRKMSLIAKMIYSIYQNEKQWLVNCLRETENSMGSDISNTETFPKLCR